MPFRYCDECHDGEKPCSPAACPGMGWEHTSAESPLDAAQARIKELESQLERARASHDHTRYWYGCRIERLTALAKEKGIWREVAAIIANGTADPMEPPTYAQQFNTMVHRMASAERWASKLRGALRKAAETFREYERLHLAKPNGAGIEKAEANAQLAAMCEAALINE